MKKSNFSKDEAKTLIDSIVVSSVSIQYTRQAVYYYLLKSGEYTTKTLAAYVKQRATLKSNTNDFNRGVMIKEIATAQAALENKLIRGVKAATTNALIDAIADYMQKHSISYYFLFGEKQKRANKKSAALKIDDIIEYIKSADTKALELIKSAAESALDSCRITTKASAKASGKASGKRAA
jgi:hypothetical protein